MPQTESTTAPAKGAYLVDTVAVAESDPFSRAFWTGRVQYVRADGTCRLITVTGYEWTPAAGGTRPATDAEREAYERGLATGRTHPGAARRGCLVSRPGEMTLRVSRDGGRTWTATRTVVPDPTRAPVNAGYPPCRCPRCVPRRAS